MNVGKHGVLLPVLGVLALLFPGPMLQAAGFFPPDYYDASGRLPVVFLLVGLGVMGLGASCLVGAVASEETIKKYPSLRAEQNPVTNRIACAVGAVVFLTMGGVIVLGWFRIL